MRFALEVPTTHSPVGWMDGGPYSQLDSPARTKLSPLLAVITALLLNTKHHGDPGLAAGRRRICSRSRLYARCICLRPRSRPIALTSLYRYSFLR